MVNIVGLGTEFFDLISEFLLVVLGLGEFVLHSFVFSGESVKVFFGEEGTLSNEFLVSSGNTKIEQVTKSG